MKRIILGLVLSLIALPALAQSTRVVSNCRGLSPVYDTNSLNVPLIMQPDGTLCSGGLGDANGTFEVIKGSSSLATGQVTVGATSTLVAAARANRGRIRITMVGAADAFCGNTGVTVTTGDLLAGTKGTTMTIETNAAVYCVTATTVVVSYMETY